MIEENDQYYARFMVSIKLPFKDNHKVNIAFKRLQDNLEKVLKSFASQAVLHVSEKEELKDFIPEIIEVKLNAIQNAKFFNKNTYDIGSASLEKVFLLNMIDQGKLDKTILKNIVQDIAKNNKTQEKNIAELFKSLSTLVKRFTTTISAFNDSDVIELAEAFNWIYSINYRIQYAKPFDLNTIKSNGTIDDFIRLLKIQKHPSLDHSSEFARFYKAYMYKLLDDLKEKVRSSKIEFLKTHLVYSYIQTYICHSFYELVFPDKPSNEDQEFHDKCKGYTWIDKNHYKIFGEDLSFGPLKMSVNGK